LLDLEHKRVWLTVLVLACPVGKPLLSCPVQPLRELPTWQGREVVDGMAEKEIDALLRRHQSCRSEREGR
jgi:hypothetical protein